MTAWRMKLIVELEAEDLDAAELIGREIYERIAQPVRDVEGVRWLLPVGDFKEREPFATPAEAAGSKAVPEP